MPGDAPEPGPSRPEDDPTPAVGRLGASASPGGVPFPAERPLPPPQVPDYTVLRRIGGGAYGEVWLGRNFTGSHFAIKVVHRCLFDHDRPFERELEGIRRFEPISRSHPSQVAIHHVGQNTAQGYFYYVMELADDASRSTCTEPCDPRQGLTPAHGWPVPPFNPDTYVPQTLKHRLRTGGRLPFAECLDAAWGLATALEHLHGHGLVHRDIKPSNVIFVGGVPKLADVGLVTSIDATRSFVGTEGFLPPEGPGTVQADIFSLGKLLYETATGKDRREFPELPTDLATAADEAALSELNAVILKACQHDPALRYPSASALREDLERLRRGRSIKRQRAWQRRWNRVRKVALPAALGAVAVLALAALVKPWFSSDAVPHAGKSSAGPQGRTVGGMNSAGLDDRAVFVLPFRPAETNGAPADLCSRVTDAFIDSLGLLKDQGLTVGPRKFGWVHLPEAELFQRVTNQSRMRHGLTGRVGLSPNRCELTLTLQDLHTVEPRWSETLRGGTNDLIELERQALAKVVRSLGGELTPARAVQVSELLSNNLEALRWVRRASSVYSRMGGTHTGYAEVQNLAQRALDSDPGYLEAHFWLAYMWRTSSSDMPPVQIYPALHDRMRQILDQDDTHAFALDQEAGYILTFQRDWDKTVPILGRLFEACPPAPAPFSRSFYRAVWLQRYGWFEEARQEQAKAEEPEPVNPDERYYMASSRWVERQYDEGIRVARRTLELHPDHAEGYFWLAHCLVAKGDYEAGIQATHDAQKVWEKQEMTALRGFATARMGQPDKAREILAKLEQTGRSHYLQPYFVARVHAALGDNGEALKWLEQAERDRTEYLLFPDCGGLRTDYAWDRLQHEPRYWQLCERLGLGRDQWPRKLSPPE